MTKKPDDAPHAKRFGDIKTQELSTTVAAIGAATFKTLAPSSAPKTVGLALSGGGIRSATFSLGVLQALSRHRLLTSVDYLSTVSGGGYIGSWLSAWIHRKGIHSVQEELGGFTGSATNPGEVVEAAEVSWLRRYSNYLTPRVGALSLDSLTLVSTWVRNVTLIQIVVLSFLAALFLFPLALLQFAAWLSDSRGIDLAASWVTFVFFCAVGYNLWHQSQPVDRQRNRVLSTSGILLTVVAPGVLAACLGSFWFFQESGASNAAFIEGIYIAGLFLFALLIWLVYALKEVGKSLVQETLVFAMSGGVALLIGIGAIAAANQAWEQVGSINETFRLAILIALGPPGLLFLFWVSSTVFIGLVGRNYSEPSREWWSRLNAWFFTISALWLGLCLLSYFALPFVQWSFLKLGSYSAVLGTGWIGSLLAALFLKKPEGTSKTTQLRVETALDTAALIFVGGFLLSVAAATSWGVLTWANVPVSKAVTAPPVGPQVTVSLQDASTEIHYKAELAKHEDETLGGFVLNHADALHKLRMVDSPLEGFSLIVLSLFASLSVLGLFGWRVDINKFSLHNMYKNRLVRCYLGASNATRNEQLFTGLDEKDDLPLHKLGEQRPYHIINAALNLSQGSNLAWQERKAASFIFTPKFCGYELGPTQGDTTASGGAGSKDGGLQSTQWYGRVPKESSQAGTDEEEGLTLGMAMATSGAAISPNMGFSTTPARAFVLTLFNMRLGRWSPNPARSKVVHPSPRFGLLCLLQELFGYSNEQRNFVYLSDGGHFDNLGVYELVRRRCSLIIAVDAGADVDRTLGDLANAARKCRIDFGAEIIFPTLQDLKADKDQYVAQGFIEGEIRYLGAGGTAKLILIKPTLCGKLEEPVDIVGYGAKNEPFPQQTTADQFFDESQFESYRRLGEFITEKFLDKKPAILLQRQIPAESRVQVSHAEEPPALTTRLIANLLYWRVPRGEKLPPRQGSLIELALVSFVASVFLAILISFIPVGQKSENCLPQLIQLRDLWSVTAWGSLWRIHADNFLILAYFTCLNASYTVGYRTYINQPFGSLGIHHRVVLTAAGAVALALVAVDYRENFVTLWKMSNCGVEPQADLPGITGRKWLLAAVNGILLLAFLPGLWRAWNARWAVYRDAHGKA